MFNNIMLQESTKMKSVLSNAVTLLAMILGIALPLTNSARLSSSGRESAPTAPDVFIPSGLPARTIGLSLGFAMADFTGDTHPDLATVALNGSDSVSAQYVIEVQLTEGGHQLLHLSAPPGGILITPKDVTGDGNLDLVIRAGQSHIPVAVFLNDGQGHFSATDLAAFRAALRETTSEHEFATTHFVFNATFVSPKSYAAQCPTRTSRTLQKRNSLLFVASDGAPSYSFLTFGLNRAPPAIA
jgi:hypothetical protein